MHSAFLGIKPSTRVWAQAQTRQVCNLFQDLWIIFFASIFLLFLPFFSTPNAGQNLQCMTLTHYFLGFHMHFVELGGGVGDVSSWSRGGASIGFGFR